MLNGQLVPLQDGDTALHCAAYYGHEEATGMLLQAGADREAKNNVSGERERESGGLRREGGEGTESRAEEEGSGLAGGCGETGGP